MEQQTKKLLLYCVFMSTITTCLLISAKMSTVGPFTFNVGALTYAILFLITDAVSEVFGRKSANKLIYMGWACYAIVLIFSQLAIYMPVADFWQENQAAYQSVIGVVPRIILGSLCSYSVSQYYDIWAFHFFKKITNNRYLWFRNNASTITSQFIDTLIFILIAFYGVIPNDVLLAAIVGQFLFKLIVAVIDTPLVYLLVYWLKQPKNEATNEYSG